MRAITLISKSKPASQLTPTAVCPVRPVGVKGGDVDDIVQAAAGGGQNRAHIGNGPPDLILEKGLWRAVFTAADLTDTKRRSPERMAPE